MTYIEGLMLFNQRVLSLGAIKSNSFDELKQKLFFNKIFISNCNELFYKYKCDSVADMYGELLDEYTFNISSILSILENPFIDIEGKVAKIPLIKTSTFVNDVIYYITQKDDQLLIQYLPSKHPVYTNKLNYRGKSVKADHYVKKYLDSIGKTSVATITSNSHRVTKVEYYGDVKMEEYFHDAHVYKNPYLYLDDIEKVIESRTSSYPVKRIQKHPATNIQGLYHRDLLVEYPTITFDSYLNLLTTAAHDPNTESIYLSLYRIGKDPSIYHILKEARINNTKVHVNIELFASNEEINQYWMKELQKIGCEVTTYAAGKLKVHSKLSLIKFSDGKKIAQIGTGNYHTQTTTQYTDLSLITADKSICKNVEKVFNLFKGKDVSFSNDLLVTCHNFREEFMSLIESQSHPNGYIALKCNAFDDKKITNALDNAIAKGCKVDAVIRGACTWYNPKAKVISILWDKLEHSRIFYFGKTNPIIYMGSLDLTTKKIDARIETLVLVKDINIIDQLVQYMNKYIINTKNAWLLEDGKYVKLTGEG